MFTLLILLFAEKLGNSFQLMFSHHVVIPLLEKKPNQNQIKLKQLPCFRSSVLFRTNVSCKKQVGWLEGGWMSPAGSGCARFSWMRTSLILWWTGYTIWATSIYGLALQFMFYEVSSQAKLLCLVNWSPVRRTIKRILIWSSNATSFIRQGFCTVEFRMYLAE